MESSRDLVRNCVMFKGPSRVPRHLWFLPWARIHHPAHVDALNRRFPSDIVSAPDVYNNASARSGDPYAVGDYVDEWGCVFENIQAGVIGEVKHPLMPGDVPDVSSLRPPYEMLPGAKGRDAVNRFCASTECFVLSGCCPRPWERYQFLRGSENSYLDVMDPDSGMRQVLKMIHDYYLKELEFWCATDVDAIAFMDDWGSQLQLLIPPPLWRELFKPLYRDYCQMAHAAGKFTFMHSDGNILEIYRDLIEVGVDALNSQLFVMDMKELAQCAKGRITFWGEIDRQHVLPSPDPEAGRRAVRTVVEHLYEPDGGIIAQFEYGPGTNPEVATAILEEWARIGI